jgi:hypothetical protein
MKSERQAATERYLAIGTFGKKLEMADLALSSAACAACSSALKRGFKRAMMPLSSATSCAMGVLAKPTVRNMAIQGWMKLAKA